MTRPIGVLRPEPGNAATAALVEAAGHVALRLPLFAVGAAPWTPPDPSAFDSLLISSANVFRHGGPNLARYADLPVHAVGATTARAAAAAGFGVVAVGASGIDALAPPGRVLRLTGRDHRPYPRAAHTAVVYASDPRAVDLVPLSGGVALVHSARAAARLAALCDDRSEIAIAAISAAAAAAAGDGWRAVAVADRPTDIALIAAALPLAD